MAHDQNYILMRWIAGSIEICRKRKKRCGGIFNLNHLEIRNYIYFNRKHEFDIDNIFKQ